MSWLYEGRTAGIILIFAAIGSVAYAITRAKATGKTFAIKAPAGLGAIEEALGRAAEMGKPVHFAPGGRALVGRDSVQVFAGLTLLRYACSKAADLSVKMFCSLRYPELIPLCQDIMREEYVKAGTEHLFKDDENVRYHSTAQMAFASGIMGLMHREKVAANFMLGPFTSETLVIAEAGAQAGAIQIGGMAALGNIPFLIATCDYVLIGEELFTAAAIADGNTPQLASIRGQDLLKLVILGFVGLGIVLKLAGIADLAEIMTK